MATSKTTNKTSARATNSSHTKKTTKKGGCPNCQSKAQTSNKLSASARATTNKTSACSNKLTNTTSKGKKQIKATTTKRGK